MGTFWIAVDRADRTNSCLKVITKDQKYYQFTFGLANAFVLVPLTASVNKTSCWLGTSTPARRKEL